MTTPEAHCSLFEAEHSGSGVEDVEGVEGVEDADDSGSSIKEKNYELLIK